MFVGLLVAAACRPATPARAPASPTLSRSPATLLVGATIFTMTEPEPRRGYTAVVRQGRIVAVEPAERWAPVEGDEVIDLGGKFLVPGLADMHVHNWLEVEHTLYLAHGVTTLRIMSGAPMHLGWREEIEEGQRLGPTLVVAGPIIDGPPGVWPGSALVSTAEEARRVVRDHHEAGYDQIKLYSLLSREAFEAALHEGRALGITTTGHVPASVGLHRALELGFGSIEHLTGYFEALQSAASPYRTDREALMARPYAERWLTITEHLERSRAPEVAGLTVERGGWNTPTLIVHRNGFATGERLDVLLADPRMRWVPEIIAASWRRSTSGGSTTAAQREALERGFPDYVAITRSLHDAGCDLMVGSDAPNPFVFPGSSAHEELALLVDAGLSPYEALVAATANPARYLGQVGEFGVIASGARADLLALDADPVGDITHTMQIAGVMVRGRWLSAETLEQMLEDAARAVAQLPTEMPRPG